jgi:cation:H+ antiporter
MLLSLLGLAGGLALLSYAADHFVIGAARISARLRLSTVVIGAVVIGFGTSAPEMVVSGIAAAQGSLDIAAGNIIGSNVANLTLVLGLTALVTPVLVASPTMRREAPLSLASVALYALVIQGGLTALEALLLALTLFVVLWWILRNAREADPEISVEVEEFLGEDTGPISREVWRTVGGLVGTLIAAQLLVSSARELAATFGLAEGFVGLTIVAIGTSLPELATSLQAARKDETDLIVGNLLGSNIFNSLGVAAVAGLAGPGPLTDPMLTGLGVWLMLGVALVATLFMLTGRRVVRWEGGLLVIVYLVAVPALA